MKKLLTREEFKSKVLDRDCGVCVFKGCISEDVTAHHLIDRDLWKDESEIGGYFVDNGASLCPFHHLMAEKGFFPPHVLREWASIDDVVIPKAFDPDKEYDKWGASLKKHGASLKYPRTPYLPSSPSADRKRMESCSNFIDLPVVVTTKMDGSNVVITKYQVAARNAERADHRSFNYLKQLHNGFSYKIPTGYQIYGEWLYAKHSIKYSGNLAVPSYLMIFAIYNTKSQLWLGWDEIESFAKSLGYPTVPVLKKCTYTKIWDMESDISTLAANLVKEGHEGLVIRSQLPFHYGQFSTKVAKWVRHNHVQTTKHWSMEEIDKNDIYAAEG